MDEQPRDPPQQPEPTEPAAPVTPEAEPAEPATGWIPPAPEGKSNRIVIRVLAGIAVVGARGPRVHHLHRLAGRPTRGRSE